MPSQVARGRSYSNKDDLDRAFGIVESEVKTSWKILAMELGQTLDEVLVFERQSWDVQDQCRKSLEWWRLMAGRKGATVPNLVRALRRCRLDWVADKIEGRSPIRVLEKKKMTLKPERITPVTEDSHSPPVQPETGILGGMQFIKEAPKLEQSPAPKQERSPSPVQMTTPQDDDHSPTFIIVKRKSKTRKDKKRSQSEPRKSKVTISVNQEQARPSQQPVNQEKTRPKDQSPKAATHYTPLQRSETIHSSAPTRAQIGTAPPNIVVYDQVSTRHVHREAPPQSEPKKSKGTISVNQEQTRPREQSPKATKHYTKLQRSETIHSSAPTRAQIAPAPAKLPVAPPRTKQTRHSRFLEHRGRAKPRERTIDGIKSYQRVSTRSKKKPRRIEDITDWTKVTIHPPETRRERRKERPSGQSGVARIVPSTSLKTEEDELLYWEKPSKNESYGPVIPILQTRARETPPPVVPPRRKRRKSSSRRPSTIYTEYLNNEHETSDENGRREDERGRRRSYRGIVLDRETDRVEEDPLQVRPSTETSRRQLRDRSVTDTTREPAAQAYSDDENARRKGGARNVPVNWDVEEENRQNLDTEAVQESHRYDNLLLVGSSRQTFAQQRRTVAEDQATDNRLNANQEQTLEERYATTSRRPERNFAAETGEEHPFPLHYAEIVKEELIIYYPLDEFETDSNYSESLNDDTPSETSPSEEPVFHTAEVLREEMVIYVPQEEFEPVEEVQSATRIRRHGDNNHNLNAGRIFEEYVSNHDGRRKESADRSTGPYMSSANVREDSEIHTSQGERLGRDYVEMSRRVSRESTGGDETQDRTMATGFFYTESPGKNGENNKNAETDDVFDDSRFTRLGLQRKAASVERMDSLRKKSVSFSEQPVVIPASDRQEDRNGENYADAMLCISGPRRREHHPKTMRCVVAFATVVLLVQLLGSTSAAFFRHHRELRIPDRFGNLVQRVRVKKDLSSSVAKNRPANPFAGILKRVKKDLSSSVAKSRPANPFAEILKRRERSFGGLFGLMNDVLHEGEHMLEVAESEIEQGSFQEVDSNSFEEDLGNGEKAKVHEEVLEDKDTGASINCVHDDDCDGDMVCFGPVFDRVCGVPYGEGHPCFQDDMCRRDALCVMGKCKKGAVQGQEGCVCHVAADCQDGLCCGYMEGDEFIDIVTPVCRPFFQEGERCGHGGFLAMLMGSAGDCSCNTGLHCAQDEFAPRGHHVCTSDESQGPDAGGEPEDIPLPPIEDDLVVGGPHVFAQSWIVAPEHHRGRREIRAAESFNDISGVLEKFRQWVKVVVGMVDQAEGFEEECPETEDGPENTDDNPNIADDTEAEPKNDGFDEFLEEFRDLVNEEVFPSDDSDQANDSPEKTDDSPKNPDDNPENTDDNPKDPEDATEAEKDGFDEFLEEFRDLVNEEVFPDLVNEEVFPSGESSEQADDTEEDFPDDALKFKPFREE
ncbi:hypothetical protein Bbelb_367130 [Branchiostoma belcheri]|nr:hypothetical protein Bbelb_367130 [Branchiostoma belcheri]